MKSIILINFLRKFVFLITLFLFTYCKVRTIEEEVAPITKHQLNLIGDYECYLNYDYNKDSIYIGKSILKLDIISIKNYNRKYRIEDDRLIFESYIKFNNTLHQYFYEEIDSRSFKITVRDKNTFIIERKITLNFGGTNNIDTQETILFRRSK